MKQWSVLLILGILLSIIALPTEKTTLQKEENKQQKKAAFSSGETEKEKMERSLEEFLGNVTGVGNIKVLLSVSEETDSFYGTEKGIKVTGVLVAAEGAENSVVAREIQQAIMALFQIEAHKIKVMKMQ